MEGLSCPEGGCGRSLACDVSSRDGEESKRTSYCDDGLGNSDGDLGSRGGVSGIAGKSFGSGENADASPSLDRCGRHDHCGGGSLSQSCGNHLIGRSIAKDFPGCGQFWGTVTAFFPVGKDSARDSGPLWEVKYEDGDTEDLNQRELKSALMTEMDDDQERRGDGIAVSSGQSRELVVDHEGAPSILAEGTTVAIARQVHPKHLGFVHASNFNPLHSVSALPTSSHSKKTKRGRIDDENTSSDRSKNIKKSPKRTKRKKGSAGQPEPTSTEAVACSTRSASDLFDSTPRDKHVLSLPASSSSSYSSSPLLSPDCSSSESSCETNLLVCDAIPYLSCSNCGRFDLLEMDPHEPGTYYCTPCLPLKSRPEEKQLASTQDRTSVPVIRGERGDKRWPHDAINDDDDDDDADLLSPSQEYLLSNADITNRSRTPTASPLASEAEATHEVVNASNGFDLARDAIVTPSADAAGNRAHAEALAAVAALAYAPSAPRPRRAHARAKEGGVDRLLRCVFDNDRVALTASLLSNCAPSLESLLTCVLLPRRGAFAELILARDNSLAIATITKATLDKTSHALRAFLCEFVVEPSAVTAALSLLSALTRSGDSQGWTCLHFIFSAEPSNGDGGGEGGWEDDVHKASLVAPLVVAAINSQDRAFQFVGSFSPETHVDSEPGSVKQFAPTRVQNRFDHRGLAPLHLAASLGHAANVRALLRLGTPSLFGGSDGVPLDYNCSVSSSCKVDPLLRCRGGFTALHWCCVPTSLSTEGGAVSRPRSASTSKMGHAACARLLLSTAPELFGMTDQDGRTALDWAQYLEDEEIEDRTVITVLREHQGKHYQGGK
mmetsp:Transcript_86030/g.172251  ORF Transcript_86030/g.172251 Transcript_86030/m.172251 type:complete len:836 (-) Transcript_86030:235-2742(-)